MRILAAALTAVLALLPFAAKAQDAKATLEAASKALGTADVKSIEMQGSGVMFLVGQSAVPGGPWPLFNVRTFTRVVNYDSASLREDLMRTRALEPPRGGGAYVRGEHQLVSMLSGDHAWNVMGQAAVAAPIALADRQFQFWSTPHGVIKAAMANPAGVQGRTIAFGIPGRFQATAALDAVNLIERVDGTLSNSVLGDMAVTVSYEDYRDFGGVKFPTKIRQTYGGFPALELTITEVRANGPADIQVPDNVRLAGNPYTRVQSQKAADGVWYVTGGSHHSVVIEMKDHLIVAEGPLNDDRALAVIAEARKLAPGKPIKYLIVSHHHFDHSGGVRAFAGEGATIVTQDASRAFFEQIVAAPATVGPDHLARSGRKATVEGVRDRRELSDGTRTVEVRHIAGIQHADDMLMVYLPKEKFLIQADAYTPPATNMAPMSPPNPFTVSLLENITKQGLAVDQILPLHGRMVPLSELQKAAGHSH
jgi:glyoxylase-like metal-dependent hydrolase (beta-lactamase superfamily II)